MSRPEERGCAQDVYDAREARKYETSSRMQEVQREITLRALELLALPRDGDGDGDAGEAKMVEERRRDGRRGGGGGGGGGGGYGGGGDEEEEEDDRNGGAAAEVEGADEDEEEDGLPRRTLRQQPALLLDIGAGTGLSGAVLEAEGHTWIGCDISRDMLSVAAERGETTDGDLVESDMGQGLPFRPGTFDGVVSVSALQWLCYAESKAHDPRRRLNTFFSSLYTVMKRTARAALQFYPNTPEQAVIIATAAMNAGFTGGLVVDYPHSAKAKKYYLCLSFERGYRTPDPIDVEMRDGSVVSNAARRAANTAAGHGRRRKDRSTAYKSRDWIRAKKDRQRRQGKNVRRDSKYTGRKRRDPI